MPTRHDVVNEQAKRQAEVDRQIGNGVQHFNWTYVQRTAGYGFRVIKLAFDLAYVQEPVFTHGSALVSVADRGLIPVAQAMVMRWLLDDSGRLYLGVQVLLTVDYRVAYDFNQGGVTAGPTGSGSGGSGGFVSMVTVAHNLSFAGPGRHRSRAEVLTAAQLIKNAETGITP